MPSTRRTPLHFAAGALILGLDWLLFSGTLLSAGTAGWLTGIVGFVIGGLGTAIIQRRLGHDSLATSLAKAIAAGVVVGAPFPIFGTAVGGLILVMSGLDRILKRPPALPER